jgi:hypothetical protein
MVKKSRTKFPSAGAKEETLQTWKSLSLYPGGIGPASASVAGLHVLPVTGLGLPAFGASAAFA